MATKNDTTRRTNSRTTAARRYVVRYRDRDPGCPVFCATVWAQSVYHAEEVFWESGDPMDDDWELLSVRLWSPRPEGVTRG